MRVDDYSRFTWVGFLKEKAYTFKVYRALCLQLQREQEKSIYYPHLERSWIKKFGNAEFNEFCGSKGIVHELSAPIIP